MKLFIFGKSGMLGNTLVQYLSINYSVVAFGRNDFDVLSQNWGELNRLFKKHSFQDGDIVVNCIGIIPQRKSTSEIESSIVNSQFPHELASIVSELKGILIHISTNCVFPHSTEFRNEDDTPSPDDIYGLTKYKGEPTNATILRISIIGEENDTHVSLLSWALSMKTPIQGYEDHMWNGVTCLQVAKYIQTMINKNIFWKGVRHIYSSEVVSKYKLIQMIYEIYNHQNSILPKITGSPATKLLSSKYSLVMEIPSLYEQILEQKKFFKSIKIECERY